MKVLTLYISKRMKHYSVRDETIDYADKLIWLQPRGDYQRLAEAWNEIKVIMGQ